MSHADRVAQKLTVAAVQMHAVLGDVDSNLKTAARWAREAMKSGAEVVVLPEFFTSGLGFHPSVIHAQRPIDGEPKQLLQALAREGTAWVGGSFLSESGGHVYNTFMLALPDGSVFTHDKDFPTGWNEHFLYAGGEDAEFVKLVNERGAETKAEKIPSRSDNDRDGVFSHKGTRIGTAMCWELARKRTDRRLLSGQADIVLAGSAWYAVDPTTGAKSLGRTVASWQSELERGLDNLKAAPSRMSRMTGAAVVHANLVGQNASFDFPAGNKLYNLSFLGESQIVDHDGTIVDKRSGESGEGVVLGEVTPLRAEPQEAIGDGFWHFDIGSANDRFWYSRFGRDYYLDVTRSQRRLYEEWRTRRKE